MMRIGLFAAADEARLLANIAKVLPIAIAPRCGNGEHALIDAVGLIAVAASFRGGLKGAHKFRRSRLSSTGGGLCDCGRCELGQPAFKGVLHKLGIGQREAVLGGEGLPRPACGAIGRRDVAERSQQLVPQRGRLLGLKGVRPLAMDAVASLSIAGPARRSPRLSVTWLERDVRQLMALASEDRHKDRAHQDHPRQRCRPG